MAFKKEQSVSSIQISYEFMKKNYRIDFSFNMNLMVSYEP
jgi:hypothetical protein